MGSDIADYAATVTDSPAYSSLIADVIKESVAPSALNALEDDPLELAYDIAFTRPAAASVLGPLPTAVDKDLGALLAKPIVAFGDVGSVLKTVTEDPSWTTVVSELEKDVPSSVFQSLEASPVKFIEHLVTDTTIPAWVTAIPTPIQQALGTLINEGMSLIASDFEDQATKSASASKAASKTASPGAGSASSSVSHHSKSAGDFIVQY